MITKLLQKKSKISTYSKIVILLLTISIGFIIIFSALFYYNYQLEKEFTESSKRELEQEVNALLDSNADSYTALINDISYWDELVNFVEKKDVRWFNNSLSYLVDTNKVDYIDAYNLNYEFITKVSTTKISAKNFIPKSVFPKLYKDKLIKFYVKTQEGLLQVYGATIHSSEDPFKNKTKPRGYFFISKLIDYQYFANFEKMSGTNATFYNVNIKTNRNDVFYKKEIKDFNNQTIETILFKRNKIVNFNTTKIILLVMFLGYVISILLFLYYAQQWTRKPIKLIKEVLEKGSLNAIDSLKHIRGEYRYIGILFEENNNKKVQLQKAKIKAEESDKLKSAFLMNLSHEIRTPMNAIMGFSDLLLKSNNTDIEKEDYIKIIQERGKNLLDIIDNLLEISKIDSNVIELKYSSFNVTKMLDDIFNKIKNTIGLKKEIDFKISHPKELLNKNIITDPEKLSKIIFNLLTNAVKFTNEGFVFLDYNINKNKNSIDFIIKDSGIGIPKDRQQTIFNRFNKIEYLEATENTGLGLGLAISKAYVELLGGSISMESQVGVGSSFVFSIPFIFDDNDNLNLVESNEYQNNIMDLGEEEIILIAEDDNLNFILIEKILRILNLKILRAKDGVEAVEICKENSEIDLVFMDIKMPKLDGHGAYIKIREFNKKTPIIAHSSYTFPEEIEKIKLTGFNDFIAKPIDKVILFDVLKKYIGKKV